MVYDQYARVLFRRRQLRRFVDVPSPEEKFPERLDLECSYGLTGSRRHTSEHAWEDYWRRWTAFDGSQLPITRSMSSRLHAGATASLQHPNNLLFRFHRMAVKVRSLKRRRGSVEGTPLAAGLPDPHALWLSPLVKSPPLLPQLLRGVLGIALSTFVSPVFPLSRGALLVAH
ncbi:hypothetical protein Efla_004056 [Eimeria flavescens]